MNPTVSVRTNAPAAVRMHQARGRIERHEQLIGRRELKPASAVQQGRLAGVRVADERDDGHAGSAAALALQTPMHLHAVELPANLHHLSPDDAPVGLELGLARSPCADAAAETLEVRPLTDQPRQQIA